MSNIQHYIMYVLGFVVILQLIVHLKALLNELVRLSRFWEYSVETDAIKRCCPERRL